jgi:biotin-(acetyl-CoA carboxylase) ligase
MRIKWPNKITALDAKLKTLTEAQKKKERGDDVV